MPGQDNIFALDHTGRKAGEDSKLGGIDDEFRKEFGGDGPKE